MSGGEGRPAAAEFSEPEIASGWDATRAAQEFEQDFKQGIIYETFGGERPTPASPEEAEEQKALAAPVATRYRGAALAMTGQESLSRKGDLARMFLGAGDADELDARLGEIYPEDSDDQNVQDTRKSADTIIRAAINSGLTAPGTYLERKAAAAQNDAPGVSLSLQTNAETGKIELRSADGACWGEVCQQTGNIVLRSQVEQQNQPRKFVTSEIVKPKESDTPVSFRKDSENNNLPATTSDNLPAPAGSAEVAKSPVHSVFEQPFPLAPISRWQQDSRRQATNVQRGGKDGEQFGWADKKALKECEVDPYPGSPERFGRLPLGEYHALAFGESMLVTGKTNSGKTEMINTIAALHQGPLFDQLVKPNSLVRILDARAAYGKDNVHLLAPYLEPGDPLYEATKEYRSSFSILPYMKDYDDAKTLSTAMVESVSGPEEKQTANSNLWNGRGIKANAVTGFAVVNTGATEKDFIDIINALGNPDETDANGNPIGLARVRKMLYSIKDTAAFNTYAEGADIKANTNLFADAEAALSDVQSLDSKDQRFKESLAVSAQQLLDPMNTKKARASSDPSQNNGRQIDPYEIVKNGGTIVVYADTEEMKEFAPIVTALQRITANAARKETKRLGEPSAHPTLFALDEIAHGAALTEFPDHVATSRDQGWQYALGVQDMASLVIKFGKEAAKKIIHNTNVVALRGTDQEMKEYMSHQAGQKEVEISESETMKHKASLGTKIGTGMRGAMRMDTSHRIRSRGKEKTTTKGPRTESVLRPEDFPGEAGEALVTTSMTNKPFKFHFGKFKNNPYIQGLLRITEERRIGKNEDGNPAQRKKALAWRQQPAIETGQLPALEPGNQPDAPFDNEWNGTNP
jgi:hypothetical protein